MRVSMRREPRIADAVAPAYRPGCRVTCCSQLDRPVNLGVAMTAQRTLHLKPQNLLLNLAPAS
jgi:hypothetical protein